jgi:hypothetical protein
MVVGTASLLIQYPTRTDLLLTRPPRKGESGLGKSTLINTLFNTSLYAKKSVPAPHHERPKTVAIESITAGASTCCWVWGDSTEGLAS